MNHPLFSSKEKAPVGIYKSSKAYEILVFAPGRLKENFNVFVKEEELIISYIPTDEFVDLHWVRSEYCSGSFERSFFLENAIDADRIDSSYEDGVLKLSVKICRSSDI